MLLASALVEACGDRQRVIPGYSPIPTPSPPPLTLAEIIRSGRIRVGFNIQAIALVRWDGRRLLGFNSDVADGIASDLKTTVEWSIHQGYREIFSTGRLDQWDIAFAVADPSQPGMTFSNAYVESEWAFLVPASSAVSKPSEADRVGQRIAMFGGTEFQRYLEGTLKNATIISTGSTRAAIDLVNSGEAEVVAASRNELVPLMQFMPGGRILQEPVTKLRWTIAVAAGRTDLLTFASDWVERAKQSGLLNDLIGRHGLRGFTVAAPGT